MCGNHCLFCADAAVVRYDDVPDWGHFTRLKLILTRCHASPKSLTPYRGGEDNEGFYGTNVDVWSLGVTVGEMLTGFVPHNDLSNHFAVMFKIAKVNKNQIPGP